MLYNTTNISQFWMFAKQFTDKLSWLIEQFGIIQTKGYLLLIKARTK